MIHDHKKIIPATNYVLVKPDEEMETYHLNGKATSILIGRSFMKYVDEYDSLDFEMKETVDTHAHHWPVSGKVICAPKKNIYYGHEIKNLIKSRGDDISPEDMMRANKMKDASAEFQSPVEVKEGDRVIFDYALNIRCYEDGQYFHTDIGTLFLIKYDKLDGVINENGVMPLNSNIFFEWEREEERNGILMLDKMLHESKGAQVGRITHVGTPIRYSTKGLRFFDEPHKFNVGERFIFNWQDASSIESDLHLTIFEGREIYTIRARDILALIE